MEHAQHSFPKHTKTSKPSELTRVIAVVAFILVIAGLVFYFRAHKTTPANVESNVPAAAEEVTDDITGSANLGNPNTIDLSMVEDDLNQTEKGLKTIDDFKDL